MGKHWTVADDFVLSSVTVGEAAKALGRSPHAIHQRRYALGMSRPQYPAVKRVVRAMRERLPDTIERHVTAVEMTLIGFAAHEVATHLHVSEKALAVMLRRVAKHIVL